MNSPDKNINSGMLPITRMNILGETFSPFSESTPIYLEKISPVKEMTMKEYSQELSTLKKENFALKLRIYCLEERMKKQLNGDTENIYKKNIELQVNLEILQHEIIEKNELLQRALETAEANLLKLENYKKQQNNKEMKLEVGPHQFEITTDMKITTCEAGNINSHLSDILSNSEILQLDKVNNKQKDVDTCQLEIEPNAKMNVLQCEWDAVQKQLKKSYKAVQGLLGEIEKQKKEIVSLQNVISKKDWQISDFKRKFGTDSICSKNKFPPNKNSPKNELFIGFDSKEVQTNFDEFHPVINEFPCSDTELCKFTHAKVLEVISLLEKWKKSLNTKDLFQQVQWHENVCYLLSKLIEDNECYQTLIKTYNKECENGNNSLICTPFTAEECTSWHFANHSNLNLSVPCFPNLSPAASSTLLKAMEAVSVKKLENSMFPYDINCLSPKIQEKQLKKELYMTRNLCMLFAVRLRELVNSMEKLVSKNYKQLENLSLDNLSLLQQTIDDSRRLSNLPQFWCDAFAKSMKEPEDDEQSPNHLFNFTSENKLSLDTCEQKKPSELEYWSEPDINVSKARIGIENTNNSYFNVHSDSEASITKDENRNIEKVYKREAKFLDNGLKNQKTKEKLKEITQKLENKMEEINLLKKKINENECITVLFKADISVLQQKINEMNITQEQKEQEHKQKEVELTLKAEDTKKQLHDAQKMTSKYQCEILSLQNKMEELCMTNLKNEQQYKESESKLYVEIDKMRTQLHNAVNDVNTYQTEISNLQQKIEKLKESEQVLLNTFRTKEEQLLKEMKALKKQTLDQTESLQITKQNLEEIQNEIRKKDEEIKLLKGDIHKSQCLLLQKNINLQSHLLSDSNEIITDTVTNEKQELHYNEMQSKCVMLSENVKAEDMNKLAVETKFTSKDLDLSTGIFNIKKELTKPFQNVLWPQVETNKSCIDSCKMFTYDENEENKNPNTSDNTLILLKSYHLSASSSDVGIESDIKCSSPENDVLQKNLVLLSENTKLQQENNRLKQELLKCQKQQEMTDKVVCRELCKTRRVLHKAGITLNKQSKRNHLH